MIGGRKHAEVITTTGQGPTQLGELLLALVLSATIGLERELRQKSAGLRTHTLVGLGAALFMLVSKYGFGDLLGTDHIALDPSRIAAQVVSGIGFIGGGLIFVRRDAVHGLTTAAVVWVTAAIGMACGAGLWLLAIAVTGGHFVVTHGFPAISSRLKRGRYTISELRLTYRTGHGTMRDALIAATGRGFKVVEVNADRADEGSAVTVVMEVQGAGSVAELAAEVSELPGVLQVTGDDLSEE